MIVISTTDGLRHIYDDGGDEAESWKQLTGPDPDTDGWLAVVDIYGQSARIRLDQVVGVWIDDGDKTYRPRVPQNKL